MKKTVSLIVCLLISACMLAAGCGDYDDSDDVTVDGIIYHKVTQYTDGKGGTECYYVYGCSSDTEVLVIPGTVNNLPVLGLKDDAFWNNTNLKEVTLPDTITSISMNCPAFSGCTSIEKMTLATCDVENLFAEYGSSNENNVNPLPESLKCIYLTSACTKISTRSFRYCRYLQEIYIPSSVTRIDDGTDYTTIGVNGNSADTDIFADLPFLGCDNLTIYCESSAKPDGWDACWNYTGSATQANVVWGGYSSGGSSDTVTSDAADGYTLFARADGSVLSGYSSSTTVNTTDGGTEILLGEGDYNPCFKWDLSGYSFDIYSEYKLVFKNLLISGQDSSARIRGFAFCHLAQAQLA